MLDADGLWGARVRVGDDDRLIELDPLDSMPGDPDSLLVPAPFDLHMHGAGGRLCLPHNTPGDLDEAIREVSGGPYEYVATLPLPDPKQSPEKILAEVARAAGQLNECPRSMCAGLRLEGGFVSPDRPGIWPPGAFLAPDLGLLHELVAAGDGHLRIIDVAPELPGAIPLIEAARELGLQVAIAHSSASFQQAKLGFAAGATIATHLFNAMTGLHHREPGIVGAALSDDRVYLELIADGVHVHHAVMGIVHRLAPQRTLAISDASPFAGLGPGTFSWAGHTLTADESCLRAPDGTLAGSNRLLTSMLIELVRAGIEPLDAVRAACLTPRQAFGLPTRLEAGQRVWHIDLSSIRVSG